MTSTTLLQAQTEIELLKRKIDRLESELQEKRKDSNPGLALHLSPLLTPESPQSGPSLTANDRHRSPLWCPDGIHIRSGHSPNETWYGPSSLFHFIGRISSCLGPSCPQPDTQDKIVNSNPASSLLDETSSTIPPTSSHRDLDQQRCASIARPALDGEFLSPVHEEYFLELYWHSYHASVFPILNEAEFKQYYRSLWTERGNMRRPSPLVDIVIAMSMQLGVSSGLPFETADGYETVAGQAYYLRCQRLLAYELESPSVSTLQCQILCSVYLCCATFHNMADGVCASVVRTAYMLGLHLDPPSTIPPKEREMRRRLAWAVYILDSKLGMKHGRPFLISQSQFSTKLPGHALEIALQAGSSYAPLGHNLTWLSFHHEHAKLFLIARAIYSTIFQAQNPYDESITLDEQEAMKTRAIALEANMKKLEEWADFVPGALKTKRTNNTRPFSTDTCALNIDPFAPLWLQRQRLLLELMYHNLCTNLYRPFLSFDPATASHAVELASSKCASHASTLTNILHQVLSSNFILNGWHEAFQWQWNASMTLVGFVLAYPLAPSAADAKRSIDLSLSVLDQFGESLAVAARAAKVVRQLLAKIKPATLAVFGESINDNPDQCTSNHIRLATNAGLRIQATGTTLNMAFDVDQWAIPEMFWPLHTKEFDSYLDT
ncbi:unnamed protein product [Clonostachys byssicola]|uniref:Xylanolytic transcriptional activator regulatory domain-containing protein n=1 Tax=Clonostachys byssicola TaxID=160290 RepID=A0A9N9U5Z8_9HYPO|nr:unnamed protein product [Clonostachys byssicola]